MYLFRFDNNKYFLFFKTGVLQALCQATKRQTMRNRLQNFAFLRQINPNVCKPYANKNDLHEPKSRKSLIFKVGLAGIEPATV